jgi:hypothetical protein
LQGLDMARSRREVSDDLGVVTSQRLSVVVVSKRGIARAEGRVGAPVHAREQRWEASWALFLAWERK